MTQVSDDPNFDTDLQELTYVPLGVPVTGSTGSATVIMDTPSNVNGNKLNLMVRSGPSDECYFFDLANDITYLEPSSIDTSQQPSPMPSDVPTTFVANEPSSSSCGENLASCIFADDCCPRLLCRYGQCRPDPNFSKRANKNSLAGSNRGGAGGRAKGNFVL